MKTGGILSRLTGDVDTTTGLLQMAIVSPAISIIRLVIAVGVLLTLNWRLALMALAIIPGAMLMSFIFCAAHPAHLPCRSARTWKQIDGRVGETFSGIRVVRAFGREMRELLDYMLGGTPCCARKCSRIAARWFCGRRGDCCCRASTS